MKGWVLVCAAVRGEMLEVRGGACVCAAVRGEMLEVRGGACACSCAWRDVRGAWRCLCVQLVCGEMRGVWRSLCEHSCVCRGVE